MRQPATSFFRMRVWNGTTRTFIIVAGGLLVLQSSDELDLPKVAYLIVAGVCVAGSLMTVVPSVRSREFNELRGLLIASLALAAAVALSFPVALASGTPVTSWLRDAANYALVAVTPVVALDAYGSASRRSLLRLLLLSGGLAAASYVTRWADLRHILDFPIDRLALPSGHLTTAFFVTLVALSLVPGRTRYGWAMAAGAIAALFVLSGGRGRLPMLGIPVLLALVGRPIGAPRLLSSLVAYALTAVVALAVLYSVVTGGPLPRVEPGSPGGPTPSTGVTPGPVRTPSPLDARLWSLPRLLSDLVSDPSFQERVTQTLAAWEVFTESPILGSGPGRQVRWVNYLGESVTSYSLDTPVLVAAKFGLVGTVVAFAWSAALLEFAWRLVRRARTSWVTLTLAGVATLVPYSWLFVVPYEDKGFSFAFMILLALGLGVLKPAPERGVSSDADPRRS